MKRYLYITTVISGLVLCGCRTDYRITVPETNIKLNTPAADASFDLNDLGEDYIFSWSAAGGEEYSIVLSDNKYLLKPYVIKAGSSGSATFDYMALDQQLALYGMKAGASSQLYWSVKPSSDLSIAASEIRRIDVKRLASNLKTPADRARLALDFEKPESVCAFSWDADAMSPDGSYEVVFSTGPQFEPTATTGFDVASGAKLDLTHEQLQTLIDKLNIDPFEMNTLYWNVRGKTDSKNISLASATLLMDGMLIFVDERDGEVYRVTKLAYSDGEEVIWFADNFRGTTTTDGTELAEGMVKWPSKEELMASTDGAPVPEDLVADYQHAYGGCYHFNVRNDIAPEGWHLPKNEEFVKLFNEAAMTDGGYAVLKHPVYYSAGIKDTDVDVNSWKFNMNAAGRYLYGTKYIEYNKKYANFHVATLPDHKQGLDDTILLHDGGSQLWYPEETKHAPVRFVYGNP